MKKEKRRKSFAYSIGTGIFAVFLFLLLYFAVNKNTAPFMLILREVFPLYDGGVTSVMNLYAYGGGQDEQENGAESQEVFYGDDTAETSGISSNEILPGDLGDTSPINNVEFVPSAEMIGISNVVYQPGTDITINDNPQTDLLTQADRDLLKDFEYLRSKLYTVDKRTELLSSDINPDEFLSMDFRIARTEGPKVLIFHTHSQEAYSDSIEGDINDGIFSVGERLKEILETKYGIETLHDKSSYDVVNGKSSTLGAYERMEPSIRKILDNNPTIELVIDMHRDGVAENVRFVTNVNGKDTAKIMLFNGLCRVYSNGALAETANLSNPYIKDNLALSFNLQLLANELYPNFTRKIYINAYRYSLHFKPKSLLIEVGAQTNTKQEAKNAMEPLAEILAKIIK